MALKWINIRSGLRTIADTEPQIAALWSSSDHSPNITQGQDFGWRLAPEVAVEMRRIKQDLGTLERIASRFGKALDDIGETDILTYISNKTELEKAPAPELNQFEDDYNNEIRKLEGKGTEFATNLFGDEEVAGTLSTEELQAELARRQTAEQTTTTTTAAPQTTTTTTEAPEPTTTSTTTESPSTTTSTTEQLQ